MADVQQKPKKTRTMHPNSLANLRSDANPGGRPPIPIEFKELAKKHSITALQVVIDIMTDTEQRAADRLKAADIVLDRGLGKAIQATEVNGNLVMSYGIALPKGVDDD